MIDRPIPETVASPEVEPPTDLATTCAKLFQEFRKMTQHGTFSNEAAERYQTLYLRGGKPEIVHELYRDTTSPIIRISRISANGQDWPRTDSDQDNLIADSVRRALEDSEPFDPRLPSETDERVNRRLAKLPELGLA